VNKFKKTKLLKKKKLTRSKFWRFEQIN